MLTYLSTCWRKPGKQIKGRKGGREGKERKKGRKKGKEGRRKKKRKEERLIIKRSDSPSPFLFPSSVCEYGIITVALYHTQIQL